MIVLLLILSGHHFYHHSCKSRQNPVNIRFASFSYPCLCVPGFVVWLDPIPKVYLRLVSVSFHVELLDMLSITYFMQPPSATLV